MCNGRGGIGGCNGSGGVMGLSGMSVCEGWSGKADMDRVEIKVPRWRIDW